MTEETADRYLLHYADKLKGEDLPVLRTALIAAPEYKRKALLGVNLYNPLLTLVFSLVFGMLAVDRFYIKDIGKGILKVLSSNSNAGSNSTLWCPSEKFINTTLPHALILSVVVYFSFNIPRTSCNKAS